MNSDRFSNLFAMRDAHVKLLKAQAQAKTQPDNGIAATWAQASNFIDNGRHTGRMLEVLADRDAAQSLLDYWCAGLEQATGEQRSAVLEEFDRDGLVSYAEAAWGRLSLDEQHIAAQILPQMARLVSMNNGTVIFHETVRRERVRHDVDALAEDTDRVLQRLVDFDLIHITPHPNASAEDQVQLANSALASQWSRMSEWLDQRRQMLRERQRLTSTAERWLRMGQLDEMLLKGNFLAEAEVARDLSELETEFVQASRHTQNVEIRNRERWRGARWLFMLVALVTAALMGWDAYYQRQIAAARQYAAQAEPLLARGVEQAFDYAVKAYEAGSFGAADPFLDGFVNAIKPVKDSNHFEARSVLAAANQRVAENLLHLDRWRESKMWGFAISPNGRWLATGDEDGKIIIADISAAPQTPPRKVLELTEHDTTVFSAAFSPDSRVLATGGADGEVILWAINDDATYKILARVRPHTSPIFSLAFRPSPKPAYSPNGDTWLATSSQDGEVKLIKLDPDAQAEVILRPPQKNSWVWTVTFSNDGKRLAATRQLETPEVWQLDLQSQLDMQISHLMLPVTTTQVFIGSAFSPNGAWLASTDIANSIGIWKVETGARVLTETVGSYFVWSVAWSADGQTLATGSGNGRIRVFDVDYGPAQTPRGLKNRRLLRGHAERDGNDAVFHVGFHPKQPSVLLSGAWDGAVGMWDVGVQNIIAEHQGAVLTIGAAPDGQILSVGRDGVQQSASPSATSAATPTPKRWANASSLVLKARISDNGRVLARLLSDGRVQVDTTDGVSSAFAIESLNDGKNVSAFAISADGAWVALGLVDGRAALKNIVRIVSVPERPARVWQSANTSIDQIAIHPNGETVAIANCTRLNRLAGLTRITRCQVSSLALWRPERDSGMQTIWNSPNTPHHDKLTALRFNQSGTRLASGDNDGLILVWEINNGAMADGKQPGVTLARYERPITAFAFSHDGEWLAAGDNNPNGDSRIVLWHLDQAQALGDSFVGHTGGVSDLVFNPADNVLFSAGDDGRVFAWPSSLEAWLARACKFVGRTSGGTPQCR